MPIVEQDYTSGTQKLRKNEGLSVTEAKELIAMGEAPHEIYTDAEKKARAEKVCGNCKWWIFEAEGTGLCVNDKTFAKVDKSVHLPEELKWHRKEDRPYTHLHTKPDFGCIHFESKT